MTRSLTPAEAERLLGGLAAGILTEAERSALFQAALEHQAVFDALMDEEALRELLADPAARAHLLAALSEATPSKVTPFWRRRPALLGLAATLLLAVTASLITLRNPGLELRKPATEGPAEAPAPKPAPVTDATPAPQPPPALRQKPQEPGPVVAPPQAPAAGAAAPAPPAALLEVVAPPPAADRAKEATAPAPGPPAPKADREERAPAAKASVGSGAALNATPRREAEAKKKAALPEWWFEGRSLLVRHPEGHWVGLLRRSAAGPVLLPSQSLGPGLTRFPLGPEPGPWELFVLPQPPAHPLQLPAEGPVEGARTRIPDPTPGR